MTVLLTPRPCGYAIIMRHSIAILAVIAAISILGCESSGSKLADAPSVLVIEINGVIDPLTANLIERGLDEAQELGTSLVVIELDTPGGLLVSTREIVGSFWNRRLRWRFTFRQPGQGRHQPGLSWSPQPTLR